MSRYFLALQYDGTNYHGWQIQQNANSVQAEINQALSTLLQQTTMVTGAGRTDTGVHAKQLYAHFDSNERIDCENLQYKLNNILPFDIACNEIVKVNDEAHARFDATARTYEYWITKTKNPFLIKKSWFYPHQLDIDLMNEAANELKNHIDFSCFSKSHTDTFTNDCTITNAFWKEDSNQLIFTITANRFLRNMVRAIVGTLIEVGRKKIDIDDLRGIINSKNRNNAGVSVPAHGLYLTQINYPKEVLNG